MRILILTQYFPPEAGAAQNRLHDLATRLCLSGHSVTVLTALPSYPKGEIFEEFRGRLAMTENVRGMRIVRAWLYVTKKTTFSRRILNYLSFAISSCIAGIFATGSADIVFVESPPLFLGISGYILSKLKRAKFVLNISDLWPESAVALGILRNERLIWWATRVEEGLYHRASFVTGQTEGIVNSIRRRCGGVEVALLTNGVSPEFIQAAEGWRGRRAHAQIELGLSDKFVVGYAGLHGLVYGLDVVLEVARCLTEIPEISFMLVGDGPEKTRLEDKARQQKLVNVFFYPSQPASRMPEILAAMNVTLITLKRHELFKGTLPSKLFEAMGAGIPIIAAMEGEAQLVIERAHCGICVEPEDVAKMKEAVLRLYCDPGLCQRYGKNGRNYVAVHYNRKTIAGQLEKLLLSAVSQRP
jgi:glycosyltransferase involved in cell wall biosynthesis